MSGEWVRIREYLKTERERLIEELALQVTANAQGTPEDNSIRRRLDRLTTLSSELETHLSRLGIISGQLVEKEPQPAGKGRFDFRRCERCGQFHTTGASRSIAAYKLGRSMS